MKKEVQSAVDFLTNILRSRDGVNAAQSQLFKSSLITLLCNRYQNHWFPEKPFKGSGYRCIRMNHNMDPLILQAGQMCGLNHSFLESTFPPELTIWVDPHDVSFRVGEEGSVGILFEASQESTQVTQQQQVEQSRNINSFLSCKDQFMNALPSLTSDSVSHRQLAGFVTS